MYTTKEAVLANAPLREGDYFRVRAVNQSGVSAWSNIFIITTP